MLCGVSRILKAIYTTETKLKMFINDARLSFVKHFVIKKRLEKKQIVMSQIQKGEVVCVPA